MCCGIYIVQVNGKLAKKRYYGSSSFFGITPKKPSLLQLCQRRRVYAGKKNLRWHRHINAFFGLKTVVNQKSVNLGMISARHTTNSQSFKKVTCPFKNTACVFFGSSFYPIKDHIEFSAFKSEVEIYRTQNDIKVQINRLIYCNKIT